MIAIDEDHYVPQVVYGGGTYKFSKEGIGGTTRYLTLGMRILVNPDDPSDVAEVHKLQDAITFEQPGGPGKWEVPNWDPVSQKKVRDALLASIAGELRRLTTHVEELHFLDITGRLAARLVRLANEGGTPLPEEFSYASDTNDHWLTGEALLAVLNEAAPQRRRRAVD